MLCALSRRDLSILIIAVLNSQSSNSSIFAISESAFEAYSVVFPYAKSWLIGKDSDAGRDWGQEEKGTTEDEMAGWHHWLDGREFEWTLGDGDGQGGLACCDSWGRKESDTTERLNWTAAFSIVCNFFLISGHIILGKKELLKIGMQWRGVREGKIIWFYSLSVSLGPCTVHFIRASQPTSQAPLGGTRWLELAGVGCFPLPR